MVKTRNFGQKSKFWSKTEILAKNRNFGQTSKFQIILKACPKNISNLPIKRWFWLCNRCKCCNWFSTAGFGTPGFNGLKPAMRALLSRGKRAGFSKFGNTECSVGGAGGVKTGVPTLRTVSITSTSSTSTSSPSTLSTDRTSTTGSLKKWLKFNKKMKKILKKSQKWRVKLAKKWKNKTMKKK